MNEYDFTQTIYTPQLLDEINAAGLSAPAAVNTNGNNVQILYSNALTNDQQAALAVVISNHVANPAYITASTQADINQLIAYLNSSTPAVASSARAILIQNIAPKLPVGVINTINAQINAATGV